MLLTILLTALIALVLQLMLPWWTLALAASGVALFREASPLKAAASGFLAIFLLWSITAFLLSSANEGILAGRLATLLSLPGGFFSILVTGLVGGIAGGLAALTGNLARQQFLSRL